MPNRTMQPPVLKGKIRVMGKKFAKNLQTMSQFIESGNINAAKNVHEKAAETFSEFEETNYELISQLNENQPEGYIDKVNDTWNIINMKIKIQYHISQENITTNFNTQDNNETTVTVNSTTDNSATNNNTNTIGQQQTSINRSLHNEQPKTTNSAQRDNLNSFWYDRLAYSSSLNNQQNRVTGMGNRQIFNQPTVRPQQLSTTLSQPVPFYTPYVEDLPKMDLQKINGDPRK